MIIEKGDKNMKCDLFIKISLIMIVVLLALNIILPILSNPATSYAAKNIQYKAVDIGNLFDAEKIESLLNNYAEDGWELVAIEQMQVGCFIFMK